MRDLSENKQFLKDITERLEESQRRTEADIENEKQKAQETRKKQRKDLERQKT